MTSTNYELLFPPVTNGPFYTGLPPFAAQPTHFAPPQDDAVVFPGAHRAQQTPTTPTASTPTTTFSRFATFAPERPVNKPKSSRHPQSRLPPRFGGNGIEEMPAPTAPTVVTPVATPTNPPRLTADDFYDLEDGLDLHEVGRGAACIIQKCWGLD